VLPLMSNDSCTTVYAKSGARNTYIMARKSLYTAPVIAGEIGWECGAQWGQNKNITTFVVKAEVKRRLGRLCRRRKNNIETDLK